LSVVVGGDASGVGVKLASGPLFPAASRPCTPSVPVWVEVGVQAYVRLTPVPVTVQVAGVGNTYDENPDSASVDPLAVTVKLPLTLDR
jgi:hypothetical protein